MSEVDLYELAFVGGDDAWCRETDHCGGCGNPSGDCCGGCLERICQRCAHRRAQGLAPAGGAR